MIGSVMMSLTLLHRKIEAFTAADAADVVDESSGATVSVGGFFEGTPKTISPPTTSHSTTLRTALSFRDSSPPNDFPNRRIDERPVEGTLIVKLLLARRPRACRVSVPGVP
jgi:hypothetical protein